MPLFFRCHITGLIQPPLFCVTPNPPNQHTPRMSRYGLGPLLHTIRHDARNVLILPRPCHFIADRGHEGRNTCGKRVSFCARALHHRTPTQVGSTTCISPRQQARASILADNLPPSLLLVLGEEHTLTRKKSTKKNKEVTNDF